MFPDTFEMMGQCPLVAGRVDFSWVCSFSRLLFFFLLEGIVAYLQRKRLYFNP